MSVRIREITSADDVAVAELTRRVMREFDCVGEGYAFVDPELEAMAEAYSEPGSGFYVVEDERGISGCGGFARLSGTTESDRTCELRKMYFDRQPARSRTWEGNVSSTTAARRDAQRGVHARCYLETTTQMDAARALYVTRSGFANSRLRSVATGHCGLRSVLRARPRAFTREAFGDTAAPWGR